MSMVDIATTYRAKENQVEILKFSEPPKRSSRTKTQKRGGVMPLLAVAVSVAVIGGMSTTLAGTISLNTAGSVEFGQGVVTTAACDTTIRILPVSSYDSSSAEMPFNVSSIDIRDIGISGGTETSTKGAGCLGKTFTLRAYDANGGALTMNTANATFISVEIPDSSTANAGATGSPNLIANYSPTGSATVTTAESFGGNTGTNGDGLSGRFVLSNIKIPGSVTKITLESSE
jgi:hypothetical protein